MNDVKRLLDEATPLPWALNHCGGTMGGDECWQAFGHQDIYHPETPDAEHGVSVIDITTDEPMDKANAALIVHAVNSLPDYEAAVDALDVLDACWWDEGDHIVWNEESLPEALIAARAVLDRLREKVPA